MPEGNEQWIPLIPPKKLDEINKLSLPVRREIGEKIKKTCNVFDAAGRSMSTCSNIALHIESYDGKDNMDLFLKLHADNITKVLKIEGLEKTSKVF